MWPFNPEPKKEVRHYTDIFGRKVTKVAFGDTGKQEKHITAKSFFGGTKTTTYITKKGTKVCHRCGSTVTCDHAGVYRCSCGKEFR